MGRAWLDVTEASIKAPPPPRRTRRTHVPHAATMGTLALLLSLATPFGLWTLWAGLRDDVSHAQILELTLLYVTLSTAAIFCAFGYFTGRLLDQLTATRERLALEAREDELTHLANRREFNRRLHQEILRSQRFQAPLSLIILDVDHFKSVNDTHGHSAGDAVLAEVARQIRSCCRVVDLPARYGGEEFAVVAPGLAAHAATQVAERIRHHIERAVTAFAGTTLHVTVSAGVATLDENNAAAPALIARADEALLRAKRAGRNQVCSPQR